MKKYLKVKELLESINITDKITCLNEDIQLEFDLTFKNYDNYREYYIHSLHIDGNLNIYLNIYKEEETRIMLEIGEE